MVSKKPSLFAVIGAPILHSLSPNMFNFVFRKDKVQACYFRMRPQSAKRAITMAVDLELQGMNVTSPFKIDIIGEMTSLSTTAQKIGSVNTISFSKGQMIGHNTDSIAVWACLENALVKEGQRCIVVGAGGAAKAAVYGALQKNMQVTIANRTEIKAKQMACEFGCTSVPLAEVAPLIKETAVLIFAVPQIDKKWMAEWIRPHLVIIGARYHDSSLAQYAQSMGCIFYTGKDWLVKQAVPAYEIFFQSQIPENLFAEGMQEKKDFSLNVISLMGMMGSGKSTVGPYLAKKLSYAYIDLDREIEKETKKSISDIFLKDGEDFFRDIESKLLQQILSAHEKIILATGGGIVTRSGNIALLQKKAINIWLYDDVEICVSRCKNELKRPLLLKGDPLNTAQKLFAERKYGYAKMCDMLLDTHQLQPEEIAEIIYEEIHRIR